ncbi:hypothetical protein BDR26DRAFT_150219 [Obelidium mucronatum]|nr:hypothetical protein BDR26DRAFT_150219 [Obelidium mucronatum]
MSTKPQVRRRVQEPTAPAKLSTTMSQQITKRASRATRSPHAVTAFWGEDGRASAAESAASASRAPASADGAEPRADIKEWYAKNGANSTASSTATLTRRSTLFETQQMMPSPGTTYFQLVVQSDRVLLRDWPRQRYSQKWTRDGGLNPGEKVYNTRYFIDGEDKDQLVYIFGMDLYDLAVNAARKSEGAE